MCHALVCALSTPENRTLHPNLGYEGRLEAYQVAHRWDWRTTRRAEQALALKVRNGQLNWLTAKRPCFHGKDGEGDLLV